MAARRTGASVSVPVGAAVLGRMLDVRGLPIDGGAAIAADAYPLFVAEGTSEKKKAKIRHNAYLYQGFKQFVANIKVGTHCMFIFGHSLAENDDHILKRIGKGRLRKLYVGIYGDPLEDVNQTIMQRAQALAALRHEKWPLEVVFYDAASAAVWG